MTSSPSSARSPRPTSVASYQSSSPRLPSPLNPSPNIFPSPVPFGNTPPRNSSVGEMSDTLSPLRERLDAGLASPRSSPVLGRPRASSFSRSPLSSTSPERSPVLGPMPTQPHHLCSVHPSPSSRPLAPGIPFSNSSPRSSSPLTAPSQSPVGHDPRPLSPSQGSPAVTHGTCSQFQSRPFYPPPQLAQSQFHVSQSSPIQIARHARTQSLIHQSFGNTLAAQLTSSPPEGQRNRRLSMGSDACPRSPTQSGHSVFPFVEGDSTPLDEAPIRWWGRRRGWADDWNESDASKSKGPSELGATRMDHLGRVTPLALREPFGGRVVGPGPFLDEEIRASFDDIGAGFVSSVSQAHIDIGVGSDCDSEAFSLCQAMPVPVPPGSARSKVRIDEVEYGEVKVGPPPVDRTLSMQKTPSILTHRNLCRVHSAGGFPSEGTTTIQGQEPERAGGRHRRSSNASTHSTTSYTSCTSGPSHSCSHSPLVSPSQSHTSTSPSLFSLGIGLEEAEREEIRSRSFWRRRKSRSTLKRRSNDLGRCTCGLSDEPGQEGRSSRLVRDGGNVRACRDGTCPNGCKAGLAEREDVEPRQSPALKHGSIFYRASSKQADVLEENAQREGYNRAEKYVSLAITSILPAATIAMLSPVGEALIKARESVKYVGHELAPVVKDTLAVSTDILSFAPLPGLEDAAKALLSVWTACQKVDTNRLSCLRLAERCATLLYSVRLEISEAGAEIAVALDEPVERLCGALSQIRTFLDTQLHRPFLKRYVRREEIARELVACNEAITDAASKFGISVQIRTYHEVCTAIHESKRFAQEIHALLTLEQRNYAATYAQPVQTWRREVVVDVPRGNALGLTTDGVPMGKTECLGEATGEGDRANGARSGCLTPPPSYGSVSPAPQLMVGPLLALAKLVASESGSESGRNTPTSTPSILSTLCHSGQTVSPSLPPTPTPTRATFVMEETKTTEVETMATAPTCPMRAIVQMHSAQDSLDAAADEAALRGTLAGALDAQNDVEMIRCLQVGRGEIPEAAETLRRMLGTSAEATTDGNEPAAPKGNTDLHTKFIQGGIEAMTRLASQAGDEGGQEEICKGAGVPELPSWTITRYEVTRTRKIGTGFFSDVYLGHWRNRSVVIKVLAHSVSREAFVRHVEMWKALDHPNVLPLFGASSAVGEKPWYFVGKFCVGGNLMALLKRTGDVMERSKVESVDVLACMRDISRGMAYLHECGVLHADLRAANVLVDENRRCVLSHFGEYDIKLEAYRSCGQPEHRPSQWKAPEILAGNGPTDAADVFAFAMCCVEILCMGDHPWATLNNDDIRELVLDKDERPPIPILAGDTEVANAVVNLVRSCWAREPERRPSFASIFTSMEEIFKLASRDRLQMRQPSTPLATTGSIIFPSTESSPADELYETASESLMIGVEEEGSSGMTDVPLTSPAPIFGHVDASGRAALVKVVTGVSSVVAETQDEDTPTPTPTDESSVDFRNEENYRMIVGLNHAFHSSLTTALWSPTPVELGAVGYLSKPSGEFVTLFNAMDPVQSSEEHLRCLPSMYGYGKFEIQRREDGKRSMAQRGLDAISGFLTFKTRNDRSHPERVARQCTFPLVHGKPAAYLCVEKTVHRYMDHLEAPMAWFGQHVDRILEAYAPHHGIQREDLILVIGTLDAPEWALFVSEDHADGRAQFNVFAGRDKGEPWGMYTVEQAVKNGNVGPIRWVDVGQARFPSKVSSTAVGGHDNTGDTVMLTGLRFERRMQVPMVMM